MKPVDSHFRMRWTESTGSSVLCSLGPTAKNMSKEERHAGGVGRKRGRDAAAVYSLILEVVQLGIKCCEETAPISSINSSSKNGIIFSPFSNSLFIITVNLLFLSAASVLLKYYLGGYQLYLCNILRLN